MGMKSKEVGGGSATGLADSFIQFLQSGLQTGSFGAGTAGQRANGADPMGSTMGMGQVLTDLFSGGAGQVGGAMSDMISKQGERDVMAMRARLGMGGGSAFGSPAAYGESMLRSETAPKLVSAIGGLQQNAMSMILPLIAGLSQKGITQRETVMEQNPWASAVGTFAPIAGTIIGGMAGGPPGAMAGAQMGQALGGGMGQQQRQPSFNTDYSQMFQPSQPSLGGGGYASGGNFDWMRYAPTLGMN